MGTNNGSNGRVTMSEINVTPMVDVMLVLLIIFMVTAPLIQQGVKVNLPATRATPVESSEKKLVLSIDQQKRIFIADAQIPLADLEPKLKAIFAARNAQKQDNELFLHADQTVPYGVVVDVMAQAQRAGFTQVGMITDPMTNAAKGKKR
jgi:biopolymer transport protein TolR